jgi:hypothetical protein
MMPASTAPKRDDHAPSVSKAIAALKNAAASPWAVACSSFLVTALFIQVDRLTLS